MQVHLETLASAGEWDILESEIGQAEEKRIAPSVGTLIVKARLLLRKGRHGEATFALRQAEGIAHEAGQEQLGMELKGNQVVLAFAGGRLSRTKARAQILEAVQTCPDSLALGDMLATVSSLRSEAADLAPVATRWAQSHESFAFSIRARTSFLASDWERSSMEVREWLAAHPSDADALVSYLSVVGHVDNDWESAARVARMAASSKELSASMVNQAAYSLVLAGAPLEARGLLLRAPSWNFRLEATQGLVALSLGHVRGGLELYASAARMITAPEEREEQDGLLRLHLRLGLLSLGLWGAELQREVKQRRLDVKHLPRDWRDKSSFLVLEHRARLNGWPWPFE
ncbi:hypothetical protein [Ornithinicoccus halotolerans]|uniref:hypothetical protein n=1 Tax=Ornithinicoccus halotolerans TaxID=1748220 RepID=UPI00188601E0|nr:hypothetical protein [Ornithinicoccus halotolerans]